MPAPRYRSRSLRKVYVRTPGGGRAVHYRYKKPKIAHCSKCGAILKGVPRERPYNLKKLSKTQRRPERPYGGVLCSRCMRSLFIERARK